MRKYNSKTKKTIAVILILFVVFIVIFSLFLKKSFDIVKTAYIVDSGSILFDNEQNMITTMGESTIKIKWGGNYYLVYDGDNYNLGSHSVVYNTNNGDIGLYGKFYEVQNTGDVKVIKDENKIKSSVNSKFYKLADRKYLIIDRTIEATNSSLVTSNYLIVNLDKSGNATLLNDKVSLKTITPTVLKTSAYTFDIANEVLNFGGEDIDLKKIIGSTNDYDEDTYDLNADDSQDDDDSVDNTGSGAGTGNGAGSGSGAGTNNSNNSSVTSGTTQGTTSTYNNNYDGNISDATVDSIINATKNTSVIRVTSDINSISVDYVVYDPNNEYKSVYIEVENTNTSQKNIVYLSKNNTFMTISDLTPNVYYNLKFRYTYLDSGNTKEYTFDEFGIYTKVPTMNLTATKIVNNRLYYKISLDNNYTITGGTINLLLNGQLASTSSISAKGNVSEISGDDCYFDISNLVLNSNGSSNILTLKLVSLSFNTYTVNPNITYKFKY